LSCPSTIEYSYHHRLKYVHYGAFAVALGEYPLPSFLPSSHVSFLISQKVKRRFACPMLSRKHQVAPILRLRSYRCRLGHISLLTRLHPLSPPQQSRHHPSGRRLLASQSSSSPSSPSPPSSLPPSRCQRMPPWSPPFHSQRTQS